MDASSLLQSIQSEAATQGQAITGLNDAWNARFEAVEEQLRLQGIRLRATEEELAKTRQLLESARREIEEKSSTQRALEQLSDAVAKLNTEITTIAERQNRTQASNGASRRQG